MLKERSEISMDKSKVSPAMEGISMVLDSRQGGTVDPVESIVHYYFSRSWMKITRRRYEIWWMIERAEELDTPYAKYLRDYHDKTYSYNQWIDRIRDDQALQLIMEIFFIDQVGSSYTLQKSVMADYREVLVKRLVEINPEAYVLPIEHEKVVQIEESEEGSEESE